MSAHTRAAPSSGESRRRSTLSSDGAHLLVALTWREHGSNVGDLEVIDMFEVLRGNPREVVIRLSEGFDQNAGAKLARCIEGLLEADRVVVDFSRLGSLEDVDVGAVARGLAGHSDLAIRGLGRHQMRLLRYCGVKVPAMRPDEDHEG